MPTIYDIDFNKQASDLMPPNKRKPKYLALFRAFVACLGILHLRFFTYYADGFLGLKWDSSTAYVPGDTVRYNRVVYECIQANTNIPPSDPLYWVKILDNYIGVRERLLYNSQKIVFEFLLNKHFEVPASDPQIYISNIDSGAAQFLLGRSGATSSTLARNSTYQPYYLGRVYSLQIYSFAIYVPNAVFTALNSNTLYAENIVRQIADKYVIAGKLYTVIQY